MSSGSTAHSHYRNVEDPTYKLLPGDIVIRAENWASSENREGQTSPDWQRAEDTKTTEHKAQTETKKTDNRNQGPKEHRTETDKEHNRPDKNRPDNQHTRQGRHKAGRDKDHKGQDHDRQETENKDVNRNWSDSIALVGEGAVF